MDRVLDVAATVAALLTVGGVTLVLRWIVSVRDTVHDINKAVNGRGDARPAIYDLAVTNGEKSDALSAQLAAHEDEDRKNFSSVERAMAGYVADRQAQMAVLAKVVEDINHAVNNRGKGQPTMSDDVAEVRRRAEAQDKAARLDP